MSTGDSISRRQFILRGLFGANMIGLRSLATGLPAAFILNPTRALAQATPPTTAKFLILSTSGAGDPINCNCPGMYDLPASFTPDKLFHPSSPQMAPTTLTLNQKKYTAAAPWATLPQWVLDRMAFIHHATLTANHGEQNRVMMLMGAVRRGEMSTSLFAKQLAVSLGTIQAQPIALSSEITSFGGQYQPLFTPTGIKSILSSANTPLSQLQAQRDADLNALNKLFKQSRSTTAERAFMDQLATSQSQLRTLSDQFASDLAAINGDDANNQVLAAAILARMGVSPVMTIHIPFGGDNHADSGWSMETGQHIAAMQTITLLMNTLRNYGLQDKVIFASLNVFGRSFTSPVPGRGHNSIHHVTLLAGASIKAGVIGGPTPDGGSLAIDPATGVGADNAAIKPLDGLASVGKTMGAALGVDPAVINDQITSGQMITAALQ